MENIPIIKRNIERMISLGAPEADIDAYVASQGVTLDALRKVDQSTRAPDQPSAAADVGKSFVTGVAKGAIGLAGLPGAVKDGIDWMLDKGISTGVLPQPAGTAEQRARAFAAAPNLMPNPDTIQKSAESLTGEFHRPETQAGRYAQTIGEFASNAIIPGGAARRGALVVPAAAGPLGRLLGRATLGGITRRGAQVVAPAVASEYAGQAAEGTGWETAARIGGALTGGLGATGVEAAIGRARSGIPGVSPTAGRLLEQHLSPGAAGRLDDLGPNAFLFEGAEPTTALAKGIAIRPGSAQEHLLSAVKTREKGGNARLTRELDAALGPAVAPSRVQNSLEQQRAGLSDLYQQVTNLNERVNLSHVADQLRIAIPQEAGATQQALRRVQDMVAPVGGANGARTIRTHPREVLNVRQALDDELVNLEKFPKAHAIVSQYRRAIDDALADAVPDIKILDQTYANLSREIDALGSGQTVFRHGPEAIRPEDLIAQRQAMTMPQREAQRIGVRADIDRMVGTKANDVVALRRLVMADGDWSRVKLAEIFGGREADRILKSIDREAAFQETFRKFVMNSETAPRLQAEKMLPAREAKPADLRGATAFGTVVATPVQKMFNAARDGIRNANVRSVEDELTRILTKTGPERDRMVRQVERAQRTAKNYRSSPGAIGARASINTIEAYHSSKDRARRRFAETIINMR